MKRFLAIALIIFMLLSGCSKTIEPMESSCFSAKELQPISTSLAIETEPLNSFSNQYAVIPYSEHASNLNIASAFVINNTAKEAIYSYNVHDKIYPASMTKIMTALLVIENGNLDDTYTLPNDITYNDSDVVCLGLHAGDTITIRELMYAMLMMSANDCATSLAQYIAGDEVSFAAMMNARAYELGATHTHFVNPHGLHDENHYTTGYDLYLIFQELLKHNEFREIASQANHTVQYSNTNGETITQDIQASNYYINGACTLPNELTIVGGKTGTTNEAGSCLIMASQDSEGIEYITLVTAAADKSILYTNMTRLLNEAIQSKTQINSADSN